MITVLHVEDDADIRELSKLSMGLFGDIEVVQCASGEDALLAVKSFTPDVFLLDMMMPGMSGSQTLQKMRELPGLDKAPVIFMTARAQVTEHNELWKLGAADIISKPFDPMALSERIKAVAMQST